MYHLQNVVQRNPGINFAKLALQKKSRTTLLCKFARGALSEEERQGWPAYQHRRQLSGKSETCSSLDYLRLGLTFQGISESVVIKAVEKTPDAQSRPLKQVHLV